jgi:hypothetical protein
VTFGTPRAPYSQNVPTLNVFIEVDPCRRRTPPKKPALAQALSA